MLRIRIRTDPHLKSPPGSGLAWTDADPHGQMGIRIWIQEVKSLENVQVHEVNTELEDQK